MGAEVAVLRETKALLVAEAGCSALVEAVAVEMRADVFVDGALWMSTALTPGDWEDYAYGAAFSGDLVARADEIDRVDVRVEGGAAAIDVRLRTRRASALRAPQPSLPGCSLPASLGGDVRRGRPRRLFAPLAPEAVWRMGRALLPAQTMHQATGAVHAAAFADRAGAPVFVREDVGRRNAVDKLVGAMLRAGTDLQDGFAYLSSRCALELVAKLARAGVRVVAAVSAPTSAVIDFADREGVALAAFARDGRFTVYAHPELFDLSAK